MLWRALLVVALGACDAPLAGVGEPCTTSEECGPGLLCDFGHDPHVCATTLSAGSDLSVVIVDLAGIDLTEVDFGDVDLTVGPDDLAQSPPDMTSIGGDP